MSVKDDVGYQFDMLKTEFEDKVEKMLERINSLEIQLEEKTLECQDLRKVLGQLGLSEADVDSRINQLSERGT